VVERGDELDRWAVRVHQRLESKLSGGAPPAHKGQGGATNIAGWKDAIVGLAAEQIQFGLGLKFTVRPGPSTFRALCVGPKTIGQHRDWAGGVIGMIRNGTAPSAYAQRAAFDVYEGSNKSHAA
jgi:hypothetical protein